MSLELGLGLEVLFAVVVLRTLVLVLVRAVVHPLVYQTGTKKYTIRYIYK